MPSCGNENSRLSKRQSEPGGFCSLFSAVVHCGVPHVDDEPAVAGGGEA